MLKVKFVKIDHSVFMRQPPVYLSESFPDGDFKSVCYYLVRNKEWQLYDYKDNSDG